MFKELGKERNIKTLKCSEKTHDRQWVIDNIKNMFATKIEWKSRIHETLDQDEWMTNTIDISFSATIKM